MRIESRVILAGALVAALGCTASPQRTAGDGETSRLGDRLASTGAPTAPTVGPEFDLGQPLLDDVVAPELEQAVATNAAGVALIVWSVAHNVSRSPPFAGTADIYAARVGSDGAILDPDAIPIATTLLGEIAPAVVSDGAGWFVTWQGHQNGENSGIFGARVTSEGAVLGSTVISSIMVSAPGLYQANRAVAYDGTNFLATFFAGYYAEDYQFLKAARVAPDGTLLDATPFVVALVYDDGNAPGADVAFDGTNWVAVWHSDNSIPFPTAPETSANVFGAHVSPAGEVIDGFVIADAPGDQLNPALSCRAGMCLVAWEDQGQSIAGALVSGSQAGDPVVIVTSPDGAPLHGPAVSWDGENWVTAWLHGYMGLDNPVESARVSSGGVLLDDGPVSVTSQANGFALAPTSSKTIVTWASPPASSRFPDFTYSYATFLADGTPTNPFVVSRALCRSPIFVPPVAAANGSNWLAVWLDPRLGDGSSRTLYGTRIGPAGQILDPEGIRLSEPGAYVSAPQVASDGTNWLVVWSQGSYPDVDVYGSRVAPDGVRLDPEVKLIAGGGTPLSAPRVAFDGSNWLVTSTVSANSWPPPPSPVPSLATRVAPDGTVLDPAGISLGMSVSALAGGNGQWLGVSAVRNQAGSSDLLGQRIADAGTLLDAAPFTIKSAFSPGPNTPLLAVADGDDQWLVVWETQPAQNRYGSNVYGLRVAASGAVVDSAPISIFGLATASGTYTPSVAYDGKDWLVAWLDIRNLSVANLFDTPLDMYAARVSTAGELLDANAFAIDTGVDNTQTGNIAGGPGRWLSLFSKTLGPEVGQRATIVQDGCFPVASTDATCDGIDDDCDGTADDDFAATATTCGVGTCAATGTTSCVNGQVLDTCRPDLADTDSDGVPNCTDACPLVPGTRGDGCPESGQGGAGAEGGESQGGVAGTVTAGAAGELHGGTAGSEIGGMTGTGGIAGKPGGGNGGTAAVSGNDNGGSNGVAGQAGSSETGGDSAEAGAGALPSAGGGHGGSAAGRGGGSGLAGVNGHAGASEQPPPTGSGCGCSVPVRHRQAPWSLGAALLGGGMLLRRRRG